MVHLRYLFQYPDAHADSNDSIKQTRSSKFSSDDVTLCCCLKVNIVRPAASRASNMHHGPNSLGTHTYLYISVLFIIRSHNFSFDCLPAYVYILGLVYAKIVSLYEIITES